MKSELNIARNLKFPVDAVTQTFAILARRGAGKTYTASVMAEEMLSANLPIVVLDPLGVWWGLKEKYSIAIFGGERGEIPLRPDSGSVVADFLVQERVPSILDVSEFGENEMRKFVSDFAKQFYRKNRKYFHWFLDEADEFAPEKGGPASATCLGAIQNIVRRGRARGIGVTLITQRSAVISKSVLTQTECLIAMQTTHPLDLKTISDWIKHHSDDPEEMKKVIATIPKFKQGEAWVYSPGWLEKLTRIKVRKRKSYDSSFTPKPGQKRTSPRKLKTIEIKNLTAKMEKVVEEKKQNDPKHLRDEIARLNRELKNKKSFGNFKNDGAMEATFKREMSLRDKQWKTTIAKLENDVETLVGRLQGIQKICVEPFSISKVDRPSSDASMPAATPKPSMETSGVSKKILDAMARFKSAGVASPKRTFVAALSGYKNVRSSGFAKAIGNLKSQGLLVYPDSKTVSLTETGLASVHVVEPLTTESHQTVIFELLNPKARGILKCVVDAYPSAIDRQKLAELNGYTNQRSSGFAKSVGQLRSMGFLDYPTTTTVIASSSLFLCS